MNNPLEIGIEAVGAKPNFRYDVIQPLLQGRAAIPGVTWKVAAPFETAPFFDDTRFRDGNFGLLDINWGDAIAASDAGWNMRWLPVFHKRKPIYSYLWIRADRGIETPRDLEGRTIGTGSHRSAITIMTRGVLARLHGVNLNELRWLSNGRSPFPERDARVSYPTDVKSPAQRLLDGEIDACTGDIIDPKLWAALESSPSVRRMFPDYEARNTVLWREHRIFSSVHLFLLGGALDDKHPDLARQIYEAFVQAKSIAYDDAQGDGPSSSLLIGAREAVRDQLQGYGDLFPYGIAANATMIDAFLDDNFAQGLTKTRLAVDGVFARGTLGT